VHVIIPLIGNVTGVTKSQNNRYTCNNVDLIGASVVKDIDIYVMWKNKKGVFHLS